MSLFETPGWTLPSKIVAEDDKKRKRKEREEKLKNKKPKPDVEAKIEPPQDEQPKQPKKSKNKKNKKQNREAQEQEQEQQQEQVEDEPVAVPSSEEGPVVTKNEKTKPSRPEPKLTPLQLKMKEKLSGARFRWINEQLYTTTSQQAVKLVEESPELFDEYHLGFRSQVRSWPENPVQVFIDRFRSRLKARPINAPGGLPGNPQSRTVTIADMGCGEADLGKVLMSLGKKHTTTNKKQSKFVVHSFDLKKANEFITVADIKNVPMRPQSVDVVVFCLALMGTNFVDFIKEAMRILKPNGELWIAEIKSRFPDNDTSAFVQGLKRMGLILKATDDSNKMFVTFEFLKPTKDVSERKIQKFIEANEEPIVLKPCIYKRR